MEEVLVSLSSNTKDYWTPRRVPRISEPVDSLVFLREFVGRSSPVVISNVMENWKCQQNWISLDYLCTRCGSQKISVNVTPDGRADALKPCEETNGSRVFVAPEERKMTMQEFCDHLLVPDSLDGIPYLSRQNDNLNEEFSSILSEIPSCVPFARDAFGNEPEAVNIWIGDERSVSSCHQDFYENIYCVLRGTKIFTLYPPSDVAFLKEKSFRKGVHRYVPQTIDGIASSSSSSSISMTKEEGYWCVDIEQNEQVISWVDEERHNHQLSSPIEIEVKAGEILYLPAMWYHRVAQSEITIAVNFWHDMQFGHMFVMNQFVKTLCVEYPSYDNMLTRELLERSQDHVNKNDNDQIDVSLENGS